MNRNVAFTRETWESFYSEAQPLIAEHNLSVEGPDEELNIAESVYQEAEKQGGLRIYTARALDHGQPGRIVGYIVFILFVESHHGKYIAKADAFYPHPDYQCGRALIDYADRELFGEGIQMIHHEVRPSHRELATMLRHLDYLPVSEIFGKPNGRVQ